MKKRILILAANPKDTRRLRLDEEVREITNGLERSIYRDEFELAQRLASRPKEFQRAMLDYKPNIVHFCGHGEGEAGIVFEDNTGHSHLVGADALAGLFELFADQVQCVVLNACYAQVQAVAIAKHIPYVIGMSQTIKDRTAIEFAIAFYDALGAGKSTEFAFKLGCCAIQLAGIPEHLTPVLLSEKNRKPDKHYNIFISYNRNDKEWVKQHLYTPLQQCGTSDNQRPRIFFHDIFEDSAEQAQNPLESLEKVLQALRESVHVIPVYTKSYFEGEETDWELKKVLQLDPYGKSGIIHPILADPETEGRIPLLVNHINYLNTKNSNWLSELIKKVGLTPGSGVNPAKFVFITQPADVTVNHTLPAIEVEVHNEDGILECAEEITISAEKGELRGTLSVITQKGRATFNDISFKDAIRTTRLGVHAEGIKTSYSQHFDVNAPAQRSAAPSEVIQEEVVTIKRNGEEVVFFENGKALVLFEVNQIRVYNIEGVPVCDKIPYSGRIRLIRRKGALVAIADWSGNVLLICDDGKYYQYALNGENGGLNIPGDIAFFQGNTYIGFWSGTIYRIFPGSDPSVEFTHEAGVQGLHISQNRFYICDLEGNLAVIQGEKIVEVYPLEESILLLHAFQDCFVAVGEKRLHQLAFGRSNIINEESRLSSISAALGNDHHLIVVDPQGKGICYNKDLVTQSRFHTIPGALPISADKSGKFCVFRYPDKTRTLMVNGRIVYSHLSGPLSITSKGDYIAFGDQDKTKILKVSVFSKLYGGKQNG